MSWPIGAMLFTLRDVMHYFEVDTVQALSDVVEEHAEYIAWVPPVDEQDYLPEELLVRVMNRGVIMPFPFTGPELWGRIDELEEELEAASQDDED